MTKKLEETFNINPEEDEISETETTEEADNAQTYHETDE